MPFVFIVLVVLIYAGFKSCTSEPAPVVETQKVDLENDSVAQKMKSVIQGRGLWCGTISEISPYIFSNDANTTSYNVLCDSGDKAITYKVTLHLNSGFVEIQ